MFLPSSLRLCLFFVLAVPAFSSEIIHLKTGFELAAKSHFQTQTSYVLNTETGTLEIALEQVASVESLPDVQASILEPAPTVEQLIETGAAAQSPTPEFVRFVQSVARVESGLRTDAVSPKGALGLMQLMPLTAKDLGVAPSDIQANIRGGAQYLRDLLIRYHNDAVLTLAAYNAGPRTVAKFGGVPPFVETRRYIQRVLQEYLGVQPGGKSLGHKAQTARNSSPAE